MATSTEKLTRSGIEIVEVLGPTMKWYKDVPGAILAYGDLLTKTAFAKLELYDPTYDADLFAGLCLQDSPGTDQETDQQISVAPKCIARVRINSTAVATPGVALAIASGPTNAQKEAGTQVNFVFTVTPTHGVCWALENIPAGGSGLVLFDVYMQAAQAGLNTVIQTVTSP